MHYRPVVRVQWPISEKPALRCYAVNKSDCTNAVKPFFFSVPLKCSKWGEVCMPLEAQSDREEKYPEASTQMARREEHRGSHHGRP